jgi:hypothetical protein
MIATIIGSYPKIPNRPRPARLRNAINKRDRGELTDEDVRRVEDEVTIEALREQAEAGLDLVTDGQIRWDDEQTYIARKLAGVVAGADPLVRLEHVLPAAVHRGRRLVARAGHRRRLHVRGRAQREAREGRADGPAHAGAAVGRTSTTARWRRRRWRWPRR